jgi:hypothetical protein
MPALGAQNDGERLGRQPSGIGDRFARRQVSRARSARATNPAAVSLRSSTAAIDTLPWPLGVKPRPHCVGERRVELGPVGAHP